MKYVVFIILPFFFIFSLKINAQEVISSGGDYFSNSNGSLSITVGEPVTETFLGTTKAITQGFHQTRLLIIDVDDFQYPESAIDVYPNPTKYQLNIRVNNIGNAKIKYKLYDSDGKLLFRDETNSQEFYILMTRFGSGTYYLRVNTRNEELKTFKIIKN